MAGPPSPLKPPASLPANVVMTPGRYVPVGDTVATAVAGADGVCVAVALTTAGCGLMLLVPAPLAVPVALLEGAPLLLLPDVVGAMDAEPVRVPLGVGLTVRVLLIVGTTRSPDGRQGSTKLSESRDAGMVD